MTSVRIYLQVPTLYADDLAIWSSSPEPLKASSVVQSSFTVLETWSNLWTLPLNPKKCESIFFSTDPHQATFQLRLYLLGIPFLFNPTRKFLGVTFGRSLSFGAHVQSLCFKFYSRHKALRSIATVSWSPTKESLSLLYKAFFASGAQICLSWMVPIPLQHRNQSLGSPTQSCMQGYYWMPLFHPLLPTLS